MHILSLLRERFAAALTGLVDDTATYAAQITAARDPKHGDYQANIAMPLAKQLGRKPQEIAREILGRLQIDDLCELPEIAGPGFINLRLREDFFAQHLKAMAVDERLSVTRAQPRSFVVDFSAPNVAKPMHVGHIRSTVIGDALVRVLRFLGHKVVSDNHLGDWGTQFGMIIYGYKHFVDLAAFDAQPVQELSRLYRLVQQLIGYQLAEPKLSEAAQQLSAAQAKLAKIELTPDADAKLYKKNLKAAEKEVRTAEAVLAGLKSKVEPLEASAALLQLAKDHADLETKTQLETAKLHEGDSENLALWKQFVPISIGEIETVYKRLGIEFDHTYGESFYHPLLADTVRKWLDSGKAVESDGAICIFLNGFDAPMIIRKRDGAYLYATTDLATIDYRLEHFQPDAILYVVDHRQSEHFKKLFAAARESGVADVELQHISFGTVLGSDGKPFKTRSGAVVGLEHLLDEAVERAHQAVCDPERLQKAGLDMSDEEKWHIAQVVGHGAIKYADLSHNRTSDYEFNTEKMVQLEGNTSTYIQYMFARTQSILRKSQLQFNTKSISDTVILLQQPSERALVTQLLQFEDTLLQSVEEYYPSVLTGYLFSVAKQFASFFDQCPVLTAESAELQRSRLAICLATGATLKQGLSLLGIGVVDRM